jgi:hypothetical protein
MARLFRPERIEHDILTVHPSSGSAPYWATAAVVAVEPDPLSGYMSAPAGRSQSPAVLYDAYQRVRSMIRDKDGNALARVHASGWVLVPGELDPDLNRGIIGLVNFGLPMILRLRCPRRNRRRGTSSPRRSEWRPRTSTAGTRDRSHSAGDLVAEQIAAAAYCCACPQGTSGDL